MADWVHDVFKDSSENGPSLCSGTLLRWEIIGNGSDFGEVKAPAEIPAA